MGSAPKIGLVSYTNLTSGVGVFAWELISYLGVDSILSVNNPVKGQEQWIERQHTVRGSVSRDKVEAYLDRYSPDVVLFLETPFGDGLEKARRRRGGFRVIGIPMHESEACQRIAFCDAIFCPTVSAMQTVGGKGIFLPIGLELFPFRQREGHVFVLNVGYGHRNDRRQAASVVKAFQRIENPDARLILNAQERWPEGSVVDDPRITYNLRTVEEPADNYAEGDIALLPMAYEGYGRMVLEAMASGMPCLTTDADPMNLFQHDGRLLVPVSRTYQVTQYADTIYNEVSVGDLHRKMEWLMTIDTALFSRRSRRQAEAQSWECKTIDYRGLWMKEIEAVCS